MSDTEMRAAFEAWTVNGGAALTHAFSLTRHPQQPRYLEGATELCWLAWKASQLATAAPQNHK